MIQREAAVGADRNAPKASPRTGLAVEAVEKGLFCKYEVKSRGKRSESWSGLHWG